MKSTSAHIGTALADMARGLAQQMVWWGHDVRHPEGNALVRHGFRRTESPGLKGTSCYRVTWEDGFVELHGAVASWTSPDDAPGCVFHRDRGRVELWLGNDAPVPGAGRGCHGEAEQRWQAALPLVRWIVSYERWVLETLGSDWRDGCWRAIRRLPKGKPWLPPAPALRWWELASNSRAPRSKSLLS